MGTTRRRKTGLLIKQGQRIYNLHAEKWELLTKDLHLDDWVDHIGHIRFGYNNRRYSFVTRYNKKGYEIQYS